MRIQFNGLAANNSCSPFSFWLVWQPILVLAFASLLQGSLFAQKRAQDQEVVQQQQGKRPNIVFFLTDDQRNDQMSCAGHPILKTPSIDLLAKRGVRFENAFVTTSICAASRASIFCSMSERTHGFTFGTPPLQPKFADVCYAKLLKDSGYKTGFVGKFGVKVPKGTQNAWFDSYVPVGRTPKKNGNETVHMTDAAGNAAIEFIRSMDTDQPFCLQVSFNAPHAQDNDMQNHYPWSANEDALYRDVKIPPARLGAAEVFDAHPDFMKQSMNRKRFGWRWDTAEKYDRNIRGYYRMLSGIDRVIGDVLKQLELQGLADNTIVIFSGDNGYYMGQRGFAGKWSHYEESLRVPLIVADLRDNGSNQGGLEKAMALNLDIPSTILDYAGVESSDSHQGRSLTPYVAADAARPSEWRSDFFCEHLMNNKTIPKWEGVRGQRYVYARYFEQQPVYEYLHDLQEDGDQLTNFASDPSHKEVLGRMRERCDELRALKASE